MSVVLRGTCKGAHRHSGRSLHDNYTFPGTATKHERRRSDATVNLELALLSRVFSLAINFNEAESNPCLKVAKLRLDNQRYQYLLPEEEPALRAVLTDQRSHLADLVPVA